MHTCILFVSSRSDAGDEKGSDEQASTVQRVGN